jgi:hypothetical protein
MMPFAAPGATVALRSRPPPPRCHGRAMTIRALVPLLAVGTFASLLPARPQAPASAPPQEPAPVAVPADATPEQRAALAAAVRLEVRQNGGWREFARGGAIGFRRLVRTNPTTGDAFRYWIEQSRGPVQMAHFRLHRRPTLLAPPQIARAADGTVTLRAPAGAIHDTLDGAPVTRDSERYRGPFALPDGGMVRAAVFAADGDRGLALASGNETSAVYGLPPAALRVVDCSSEQGGNEATATAIDGDPRTHWHSRWSPDSPRPPHHLTIDLGGERQLRGFVYLPRHDGSNGTVADWASCAELGVLVR